MAVTAVKGLNTHNGTARSSSKSSHEETRLLLSAKETSIDGWGQFQVYPIQLLSPVGAVCSDMFHSLTNLYIAQVCTFKLSRISI